MALPFAWLHGIGVLDTRRWGEGKFITELSLVIVDLRYSLFLNRHVIINAVKYSLHLH